MKFETFKEREREREREKERGVGTTGTCTDRQTNRSRPIAAGSLRSTPPFGKKSRKGANLNLNPFYPNLRQNHNLAPQPTVHRETNGRINTHNTKAEAMFSVTYLSKEQVRSQ